MKINLGVNDLLLAAQAEDDILLDGVLYTYTGKHTGRSPNAKRIVIDDETTHTVDWDNNRPLDPHEWNQYLKKFTRHLKNNADNIYQQDTAVVRNPEEGFNVRVYTERASHSLFARNMFIPLDKEMESCSYTIYHFPSLLEEPTVLISFSERTVLISGTLYSGEIKKSIFTALNYHFPHDLDYLPMHCSVNVDKNRENPVIFFGLSGTGKTTLSSDPNRILIGDDEHGWTDDGLTNFEGGCYAKTIRLSHEDEPQIWQACHTQGTILENVVLVDGKPNFDDDCYTENGRASYPTASIVNADADGYVNCHPTNVVMLTCDAFGVLPPVVKLTPEEAVKQFSLGYTAKVAGTEAGVTEPVATFSACFGAPFMPLPTRAYSKLLKEKILKHNVQCWLVNTGWTGGPYGIGSRMPIKTTRLIIDGILDGTLVQQKVVEHSYTGFNIPVHPDIDSNVLFPERGWNDLAEYETKVNELTSLFKRHMQ
jgi:phosphoenolpyruvate carboxykinase (ATP)